MPDRFSTPSASAVTIGTCEFTMDQQSGGFLSLREPEGRIWVTRVTDDAGANARMVSFSDDNGASWSDEFVAASSSTRETRAVAGLAMDFNNGGTKKLIFSFGGEGADTEFQEVYRREGDDAVPNWTKKVDNDIDFNSTTHIDRLRGNIIQMTDGKWMVVYRSSVSTDILYLILDQNLGAVSSSGTLFSGSYSIFFANNHWICKDSAGTLYFVAGATWAHPSSESLRVYKWNGLAWARLDAATQSMDPAAGLSAIVSSNDGFLIIAASNSGSGIGSKTFQFDLTTNLWGTINDLGTTIQDMRLARSADATIHLVHTAGNSVVYRRSTDDGGVWVDVQTITASWLSDPDLQAHFAFNEAPGSVEPDAGAALVINDPAGNSYYLASDDLVWPAIASGQRVSRIIVRALGAVPIGVVPLALPSVVPTVLLQNWIASCNLESTFQTDVTIAPPSLTEERRSLADRPTRIMRVKLTGMDREQSHVLLSNLARLAQHRVPVPLYCDQQTLTAISPSAGTTLWCSTRRYRLFKGQRIVVYEVNGNRAVNVHYNTISKKTVDRLILDDPLPKTYGVDASVCPVMDAEINLKSRASMITDAHVEATVTFREAFGPSAIPVTSIFAPGEFPEINGYPVLDTPPDWGGRLRTGVVRAGRSYRQGRAEIIYTAGGRPQLVHDLTFAQLTREEVWPLIKFWDSRRGRCRPFWLVSPSVRFEPSAIAQTYLDVESYGNVEDIDSFLNYLAIKETDGTITIVGITSAADNGDGTFRVNHDGDTSGISLGSIDVATSAHLVRMLKDSMTEKWDTTSVCRMSFGMIDLLSEQEVDVPGFGN